MTTSIVQSITDEQLAEIAGYAERAGLENEEAAQLDIGELRALITRLREAEADARRYRWLCNSQWYAGPWPDDEENGYRSNDKNWTTEGLSQAIDTAMERQP